MKKRLIDLKCQEKGMITAIHGGAGLINRLNTMGIRKGKIVKKVCNVLLGGPVVVKLDKMDIALGKGMASKVEVEVE